MEPGVRPGLTIFNPISLSIKISLRFTYEEYKLFYEYMNWPEASMVYFETSEKVASTLNVSTYLEAGWYLRIDP